MHAAGPCGALKQEQDIAGPRPIWTPPRDTRYHPGIHCDNKNNDDAKSTLELRRTRRPTSISPREEYIPGTGSSESPRRSRCCTGPEIAPSIVRTAPEDLAPASDMMQRRRQQAFRRRVSMAEGVLMAEDRILTARPGTSAAVENCFGRYQEDPSQIVRPAIRCSHRRTSRKRKIKRSW